MSYRVHGAQVQASASLPTEPFESCLGQQVADSSAPVVGTRVNPTEAPEVQSTLGHLIRSDANNLIADFGHKEKIEAVLSEFTL
jgi:hypothetical protein